MLAVAAVLLVTHRRWRVVAVVGAVLSSAVIGLNPGQAIVGLTANALVLAGVVISWAFMRRSEGSAQAPSIVR